MRIEENFSTFTILNSEGYLAIIELTIARRTMITYVTLPEATANIVQILDRVAQGVRQTLERTVEGVREVVGRTEGRRLRSAVRAARDGRRVGRHAPHGRVQVHRRARKAGLVRFSRLEPSVDLVARRGVVVAAECLPDDRDIAEEGDLAAAGLG